MFRDPSGNLVVGAVVGAVIGGITSGMGARLQGGSTGEIIGAVAAGALVGGFLGGIDPTEGAFTLTQITLINGGIGILGDMIGQGAGQINKKCKSFNLGEALGAGVGGMAAGYMGAVTALGVASAGGGALAQSVMGGAIGAAPATLGGPTGAALGHPVTNPDGCGCQ